MLRRILMTLTLLCACSEGDHDDACETFGCMNPAPTSLPAGSDSDSDASGDEPTSGSSSGDTPFCGDDDRRCVGDDALRFCDDSGEKLHTVACQAACGMDRVSFGCMLGDDGVAGCACGPLEDPADTSSEDTITTGVTGADTGDEGGDDTSGGEISCDDPEYPVKCAGQHGVPAGCWGAGADCTTVVECPFGFTACVAGFVMDCASEECVPVKPGFETTNALCSNGVDEDDDGYTDCQDVFCYISASVTACNGESTDFECSNGIDEDGDGYTDCDDIACQLSPAVTVCAQQEWRNGECSNNTDDDGDDYTDCLDASCFTPFASVCW